MSRPTNAELQRQVADLTRHLNEVTFQRNALANKLRWELESQSKSFEAERRAFADYHHDIQQLCLQGTHALCGATWVRVDQLTAVWKRYDERTR